MSAMRWIGPNNAGAKRIVPSRFHVPPRFGASDSTRTDPLSRSIRFSLPSAKNPRDRLSGDQNGNEAPSVDANACGDTDRKERIHNLERPSAVTSNTIFSPSGEIASDAGLEVGGVVISRRISGAFAASC